MKLLENNKAYGERGKKQKRWMGSKIFDVEDPFGKDIFLMLNKQTTEQISIFVLLLNKIMIEGKFRISVFLEGTPYFIEELIV